MNGHFTFNMSLDIKELENRIIRHDDDFLDLVAVINELTDRIENLEIERIEMLDLIDAVKQNNIRLFHRIRNLERNDK